MPKRKWTHSVGSPPNTVCVFERTPGGPLYCRVWDPHTRRHLKHGLRHRDRAAAKAYAADLHARLIQGENEVRAGRIRLSRLFALYLEHQTPQKGERMRKEDPTRVELWTRFLGADKDPLGLTLREWEDFVRARLAGEVDARGRRVRKEEDRRPLGPRTVERDLRFLLAVLHWGTTWRDEATKTYLLRENPARGYPIPRERNPKRPVATQERYEAIRAVSDRVLIDDEVRSPLSEVLDLAVATGRRLSAILGLRYSDLLLERSKSAPHGAIRWPADTDKEGREQVVPLGPLARRAIDRVMEERPGIGSTPLFPSPKDPSKPLSRHFADKLLRRGEKLAGLEPQDGSLWHAYRRMWATSRKHLPSQDVARAGGWSTVRMVEEIYTRADDDTTLSVVLHEGMVRKAQ